MTTASHRVLWAPIAREDVWSIVSYILDRDPMNAQRVLERIERRAETLCSFPERGRVVPELRDQGELSYRELIEDPWRIVYRIDGATVQVVAVLDARRQLEDLLLDRFLRS